MSARDKAKNCEIILNYDCNAMCPFCYHTGEQMRGKHRMPLEEAAEALYDGRRKGAWVAYLIGGETTLHPDLAKIAALARKMGYPYVQVLSNGITLANGAFAEKLVRAGVNLFRISIHGPDPGTHDRLVGVRGAFAKIMKAHKNITAAGAEMTVNHALNKINYKRVKDTVELFTRRLGIPDFNIIFPHYTGLMKKNLEKLQVRFDDCVPYLREAVRFLEKNRVEIENPVLINFTPCNLPEAVNLMTEWEKPGKTLENEPIYHLEGNKNRIYNLLGKLRMKNENCRRCIYFKRCMGFEKWYFENFGDGEFRPVVKRAEPVKIKPTLKKIKIMRRSGGK